MAGNRRWTENEIDILKSEYGKEPMQKLAKDLNRSIHSIHKKASDLGLSFESEEYSPSVIPNILKRLNFLEKKAAFQEELIKELNYKLNAIKPRKKQSGFSEEEIDYIVKNYGKISVDSIAKRFNRSNITIYKKIDTLVKNGIIKEKHDQRGITNSELNKNITEFLEMLKNGATYQELSIKFDVTQQTVYKFIKKMKKEGKITFPIRKINAISIADERFLIKNYSKKSYKQLHTKLGISYATLISRIHKLTLYGKINPNDKFKEKNKT